LKTFSPGACMKKFPHAFYSIESVDTTLVSEVSGQWSTEISSSYINDVKKEVTKRFKGSWLHIVVMDEWDLTTFDAMASFTQYGLWCYQNGIKASLFVYKANPVKRYQLSKMLPEKARGYITFHVETLAEAYQYAMDNHYLKDEDSLKRPNGN